MILQPAPGLVFVVPVDEIPVSKPEVGFGGKTDKQKPEQPYKFRVIAVGGDIAYQGLWVSSPVSVGDIISTNTHNSTYREKRDSSGIILDSMWVIAVDFENIMGVWLDKKVNPYLGSSQSV